jgi:hypothetical protein
MSLYVRIDYQAHFPRSSGRVGVAPSINPYPLFPRTTAPADRLFFRSAFGFPLLLTLNRFVVASPPRIGLTASRR